MKKILACGLILAMMGCSMSIRSEKDIAQAKTIAGNFITALYQSHDNIKKAFSLTSEQFKVVSNEGMTMSLLNVAGEMLGDYVSRDEGTDVTRLLAPNIPGKIFSFNVVYKNDPKGQFLVTMVKQNKVWKVMNFNINSPKITERQARARSTDTTPASSAQP